MARVLGIGGVFFRSKDPEALGAWYRRWLDIPFEHPHGAMFSTVDASPHRFVVWAPFPEDTDYFADGKSFMFNLVVDDLGGALARVAEGGGQPVGAIEEYDYGRFGWFLDPEGNKVELWEPPAGASSPAEK
jgi:predicted enzyme related to lactoylglutathione lyase